MSIAHRTMRAFELFEPERLEEAVSLLSQYGKKAKVLAGGLDLVAKMRRWQINPEVVVSIRRIPGLDYIKGDGKKGIRIGALTPIRSLELSPLIQRSYTPLYQAVRLFASVQVKTMGTVVGNICVATPASDIAPALFVLDAQLKVVGPKSEKMVPIKDFYLDVGRTVLQPDEVVTEIVVPGVSAGSSGCFMKLERTKADIAKVNVAVMVTVADGICRDARLALGAVAPTVIRADKAEEILKGKKLDQKVIAEAAEMASKQCRCISDLRSTAEYRTEMAGVLVRRAIEQAVKSQGIRGTK